jgi:hypothetical protein
MTAPVEVFDPEHRKGQGVIIRAVGDSFALYPRFRPPFSPP